MNKQKKVVVLVSITSDIGIALAKRYSADGFTVVGTYRSTKLLSEIKDLQDCHLFYCDIGDKASITKFVKDFAALKLKWELFISCPCNPLPIKPFFQGDFDEWSDSVHINAIEQLRVLHAMYPYKNGKADVAFFAGGGANNAVINFSAYTVSKIMLIKMCEFLDAENDDLNIFIVGPGWARTKTHGLILANTGKNDEKHLKTEEFMKSGEGTSMDDIYGCIQWLCNEGKQVASGRNISIVNDKWKGDPSKELAAALKSDKNMYKLRRHRNDY